MAEFATRNRDDALNMVQDEAAGALPDAIWQTPDSRSLGTLQSVMRQDAVERLQQVLHTLPFRRVFSSYWRTGTMSGESGRIGWNIRTLNGRCWTRSRAGP